MENTVAIMNATAEDMEAAIRAEEEAMERIESESEHKPQCSWENPHNYETVGSPHARNLYTKSAPKKTRKKTRKKTTAAEQQQRWLENAKTDENGKFYVVPELTYKNMDANKGWNPCFYIVTADMKLKRIGLKFALELAKTDKAIEITKDSLKDSKKAA